MRRQLFATALLLPLTTAALAPAAAQAGPTTVSANGSRCFRDVYREQYVPGSKDAPGTVRSWTEKVEIPCPASTPTAQQSSPPPAAGSTDTNSCVEGTVIGGVLGAGLGAALTRGNARWIGVPVGGVAGALVGCQVDGG